VFDEIVLDLETTSLERNEGTRQAARVNVQRDVPAMGSAKVLVPAAPFPRLVSTGAASRMFPAIPAVAGWATPGTQRYSLRLRAAGRGRRASVRAKIRMTANSATCQTSSAAMRCDSTKRQLQHP
jgi:hypothetical protein